MATLLRASLINVQRRGLQDTLKNSFDALFTDASLINNGENSSSRGAHVGKQVVDHRIDSRANLLYGVLPP